MELQAKILSVTQVAALCKVGRTAVGYWIRSKMLPAERSGRNYTIHVDDLVHFLNSTGRFVPPELVQKLTNRLSFPFLFTCNKFMEGRSHGKHCQGCIVKTKGLFPCIQARPHNGLSCPEATCLDCSYYQKLILPRIGFIRQINEPAAIVQDLFLWAGNHAFAERVELSEMDLIGIGLEKVVHSDLLGDIVSFFKGLSMGLKIPKIPLKLKFRSDDSKMAAKVLSLCEPEDCYLVVV